jgi:hypothetical protein
MIISRVVEKVSIIIQRVIIHHKMKRIRKQIAQSEYFKSYLKPVEPVKVGDIYYLKSVNENSVKNEASI